MSKFLHVDMDYFFAAVEIRDRPELKQSCVAVSSLKKRSVLATCNYKARQYGLHSGMPTFKAKELCPQLVLLPLNIHKYKEISKTIQNIFYSYTSLVQCYSLDEASLDITHTSLYNNSGTLLAQDIAKNIFEQTNLTCSIGLAPIRFLAKIASNWNKPNGITIIPPNSVESFILSLPVAKIPGVGAVFLQKLNALNIHICNDLQKYSLFDLYKLFGRSGIMLYERSRGREYERKNSSNKRQNSLSVERTFEEDIDEHSVLLYKLEQLYIELENRTKQYQEKYYLKHQREKPIKALFIVIKFSDFTSISRQLKYKIEISSKKIAL